MVHGFFLFLELIDVAFQIFIQELKNEIQLFLLNDDIEQPKFEALLLDDVGTAEFS